VESEKPQTVPPLEQRRQIATLALGMSLLAIALPWSFAVNADAGWILLGISFSCTIAAVIIAWQTLLMNRQEGDDGVQLMLQITLVLALASPVSMWFALQTYVFPGN